MGFTIRPFTPADYEEYAQAHSAASGNPVSADTIRWNDEHQDPKVKRQRWLAEADGKIVGSTEFTQRIRAHHPQKFQVNVIVHPEYRRHGIGTALYQELLAGLAPHDPITLTATVREDRLDAVRFVERLGYVERQRVWESHLNLAAADLRAFEEWLDRPLAQGYRILNLAELQSRPGWDQELYALTTAIRWDVPSDEPRTAMSFEAWRAELSGNRLWPEGYLVGVLDDRMVGTSQLFLTDSAGVLSTGLTGVLREHRGTGIAKALKARAMQVARAAGYHTVKTWNESNNQRMLAINGQLGFQRLPAWITYKRFVKPEE